MILIDASIWIDHIRSPVAGVLELLDQEMVLGHPMVIGEIALGSIANRHLLIDFMEKLPATVEAEHFEVMRFIEIKRLFGRGVGYVDTHLLAACLLMPGTLLWTRDKRLKEAAEALGLDYRPSN